MKCFTKCKFKHECYTMWVNSNLPLNWHDLVCNDKECRECTSFVPIDNSDDKFNLTNHTGEGPWIN